MRRDVTEFSADRPQYVFLNCAPGVRWNQNRPETITGALFDEVWNTLRPPRGQPTLRLGLSFILSYLDGPPETLEATLRRLLALSEARDVPIFVVLDGQNWWGFRPDLWNGWDSSRSGFDPKNRVNVE